MPRLSLSVQRFPLPADAPEQSSELPPAVARLVWSVLFLLIVGLTLSGCARRPVAYAPAYPQGYAAPAAYQGGPYVPAPAASAGYGVPFSTQAPYLLDTGDRLRVTVFGQDGISNSYLVDAAGNVNVALIGPVPARGQTTQMLALAIGEKLRQGYIREPHVGVEIEAYRPFFILGEVNAPGQYPYQPNMTVETAVAIAGGYSPRADRKGALVTRSIGGVPSRARVAPATPLHPGDTINVAERWF